MNWSAGETRPRMDEIDVQCCAWFVAHKRDHLNDEDLDILALAATWTPGTPMPLYLVIAISTAMKLVQPNAEDGKHLRDVAKGLEGEQCYTFFPKGNQGMWMVARTPERNRATLTWWPQARREQK